MVHVILGIICRYSLIVLVILLMRENLLASVYHYDMIITGLFVENRNGEVANTKWLNLKGDAWIDYDENILLEKPIYTYTFDMNYKIAFPWLSTHFTGDAIYRVGSDDTWISDDNIENFVTTQVYRLPHLV